MVDTTDEWILQRTGIRERHIVDAGVATSDLGTEAASEAISRAGISPDDIGVIIVGTVTPDMMFPSTACLIQHKIGASRAWGFDLSAACSAFTYSVTTASQLVASGAHEHALVVGADVMSSIIDYKDRSTCVLFGDGAGAVVVSAAGAEDGAILDFEHEIDGGGGPALCMPAGGSLHPSTHETVDQRLHYVKQDGATVFKFAVRKTEEIARRVLDRNGLTPADIDLFVSHQANRRIIQSATEKLGIDPDKVIINIEKFGNTTAATIPLALNDAVCSGRLKKGNLVLLASVGAGFTVGVRVAAMGFLRRGSHNGHAVDSDVLQCELNEPRLSALTRQLQRPPREAGAVAARVVRARGGAAIAGRRVARRILLLRQRSLFPRQADLRAAVRAPAGTRPRRRRRRRARHHAERRTPRRRHARDPRGGARLCRRRRQRDQRALSPAARGERARSAGGDRPRLRRRAARQHRVAEVRRRAHRHLRRAAAVSRRRSSAAATCRAAA